MPGGKQIQTVVLFDRSVDLVTPFCSQMCYEGLLDEYYNIEGGRMKIPKAGTADNAALQYELVLLSTKDDTISEGIRAMHFTKVAQEIKGFYKNYLFHRTLLLLILFFSSISERKCFTK